MDLLITLLGSIYLAYLIYEKKHIMNIRKNFKHIIHVNGTRGKSTVSRLIDAGLREADFTVLTKTTGTSPRILHVDGHESEINRKGRANIREQLMAMRLGAKEKADILVLECMAVKPELQLVCQENMLTADIGVITNARLDHRDEMGHDINSIIKALGSTIPINGTLFTADDNAYSFYKKLEEEYNTKVFLANEKNLNFRRIDFEENVSLACAVCNYLGVDNKTSITGMRSYKKDPGSLKVFHIKNKQQAQITFINALAANDPDSTVKIFEMLEIENDKSFELKVLLLNNREDRANRMEQYIDFIKSMEHHFDQFWLFGAFRNIMRRKFIKSGIAENRILLPEDISAIGNLQYKTVIFGVGNMGGYGKDIIKFFEEDYRTHVG